MNMEANKLKEYLFSSTEPSASEKELIRRAKTFRANCAANGDKLSFAESCQIVLLCEFIDKNVSGIDAIELFDKVIRKKSRLWMLRDFFRP